MVAASLLKEDADALASVDTADRLGEQWGDRDQCHLFRQLDGLRSTRSMDPLAQTPCVTTAVTEREPRATSCSAASTSVPALIVKSSTTIASRSATSPMISTSSAVSP